MMSSGKFYLQMVLIHLCGLTSGQLIGLTSFEPSKHGHQQFVKGVAWPDHCEVSYQVFRARLQERRFPLSLANSGGALPYGTFHHILQKQQELYIRTTKIDEPNFQM